MGVNNTPKSAKFWCNQFATKQLELFLKHYLTLENVPKKARIHIFDIIYYQYCHNLTRKKKEKITK